ncbi:hypothetical protein, partial [Bacillus luti]
KICGEAHIYGDVRVFGCAIVSGNAMVFGDATIPGDARVYGDAIIESAGEIICVSNVGSENNTLTAYRTKSGEIEINKGFFRGTVSEFEESVMNDPENDHYIQEFLTIIKFIKLRFEKDSIVTE